MPIWLLKFIPTKFLRKYWKPIVALTLLLTYSLALNTCAVNRTDSKWELREAERVKVEQQEEIKASREAAELKAAQDSAAKEAERKLKLEKEQAEARAAQARAEASEQRRLNDESTKKLEQIQASSSVPAQPIPDSGVRDTLGDLQDKVRSRRPR